LSLKVFGVLLFGKNDDKSFWENTLSQIFLDIACFFIGEKRNTTVVIWDEPGCKVEVSQSTEQMLGGSGH
jgi:hypothetical protein